MSFVFVVMVQWLCFVVGVVVQCLICRLVLIFLISCWIFCILSWFGLVAMENNDSPMNGIRRYMILFTEGKFAIVATIFLRLFMLVAEKPKNSTVKQITENTEEGLEVKARAKDLVNRGKDQYAFREKIGRS